MNRFFFWFSVATSISRNKTRFYYSPPLSFCKYKWEIAVARVTQAGLGVVKPRESTLKNTSLIKVRVSCVCVLLTRISNVTNQDRCWQKLYTVQNVSHREKTQDFIIIWHLKRKVQPALYTFCVNDAYVGCERARHCARQWSIAQMLYILDNIYNHLHNALKKYIYIKNQSSTTNITIFFLLSLKQLNFFI